MNAAAEQIEQTLSPLAGFTLREFDQVVAEWGARRPTLHAATCGLTKRYRDAEHRELRPFAEQHFAAALEVEHYAPFGFCTRCVIARPKADKPAGRAKRPGPGSQDYDELAVPFARDDSDWHDGPQVREIREKLAQYKTSAQVDADRRAMKEHVDTLPAVPLGDEVTSYNDEGLEKVSALLSDATEPLTVKQIISGTGLTDYRVRKALKELGERVTREGKHWAWIA